MALETLPAPSARAGSREGRELERDTRGPRDDLTDSELACRVVEQTGITPSEILAGVSFLGWERLEEDVARRVQEKFALGEETSRAIARLAITVTLTRDERAKREAPIRRAEAYDILRELGVSPSQVYAWSRLHEPDLVQRALAGQVGQRISVAPERADQVAADAVEAADLWALQNPTAALAAVVDERRQQLVLAKAEAAKVAIRRQVGIERAPAPTSRSQVGTAHRATRAARTRTARRTAAGASSARGSRDSGDDSSGEADEPPDRPGGRHGTRRSLRVERHRKLQAAISLIEELCAPECDGRLVKREAARRGVSAWDLRQAREQLGIVFDRNGRRAGHRCTWVRPDLSGDDKRPPFRPDDFKQPGAAAFLEARERWRNRPPGRTLAAAQ